MAARALVAARARRPHGVRRLTRAPRLEHLALQHTPLRDESSWRPVEGMYIFSQGAWVVGRGGLLPPEALPMSNLCWGCTLPHNLAILHVFMCSTDSSHQLSLARRKCPEAQRRRVHQRTCEAATRAARLTTLSRMKAKRKAILCGRMWPKLDRSRSTVVQQSPEIEQISVISTELDPIPKNKCPQRLVTNAEVFSGHCRVSPAVRSSSSFEN